jgi:hypothetical protein
MGAFGELLIKHFGGDINSYRQEYGYREEPHIQLTKEEIKLAKQKQHDDKMHQLIWQMTQAVIYKQIDINDVQKKHFEFYKQNQLPAWNYFKKWRKQILEKRNANTKTNT